MTVEVGPGRSPSGGKQFRSLVFSFFERISGIPYFRNPLSLVLGRRPKVPLSRESRVDTSCRGRERCDRTLVHQVASSGWVSVPAQIRL